MVWKEVKSKNYFPFENEGDVLEGTMKGFDDDGDAIIETSAGEKFWSSAVVIVNKCKNVPTGKRVKIEFMGRKKGKSGFVYKDFRVEIEE